MNSRTLSDAGPWRWYGDHIDGTRDAHVVPGFERRAHVLHPLCHCHPTIEMTEDGELYHHNVAQ